MAQKSIVVYCVDVGSIPKGKFGWARVRGTEESVGTDIEKLAARIVDDAHAWPVALGFECPLFVPLHKDCSEVLCCRPGEKNRAWSASAGISSLGAGLVESAWLLRSVLKSYDESLPVFIRPADFRNAECGILLWEAFVTGKRDTTHEQDALAAARKFEVSWPDLCDAIPCEGLEVMSLIGMAAIRAGWSEDVELLKQKPVVIDASRHS